MQHDHFLGGVVEGFYGRPWSMAQRMELFRLMANWGLNTYFYAPKDDLKHRAFWRETYLDSEMPAIRSLIDACLERGLTFVYGLSPGLDIQFCSQADRDYIKQRFAQLMDCGCENFALLFDDLPGQLHEEDRRAFSSVAEGQCEVTNDVYRWTRTRTTTSRFLFCPTPYCDRMDRWHLAGDRYLDTIGQNLDPSIDILWTGPEIVSREISVASITALSKRLRRPPLIWDNLHANDYDGRRLYAGPYSGRPLELKQHVAGILTNPNNEFPINFVPLRTLATYLRANTTWDPRGAYLAAVQEWLPHYESRGESLDLDDLILLADCFYLPFTDGPAADRLFTLAQQLITHPLDEWGDAEAEFARHNQRIQMIFDKLTQLTDRELFYAWSRHVWDLKEELQLISAYIAQRKLGTNEALIETHLPGTYRGGFINRLQRLLSMDAQGRFASQERLAQ